VAGIKKRREDEMGKAGGGGGWMGRKVKGKEGKYRRKGGTRQSEEEGNTERGRK
jgi:hypothetical protein